MCAHQDVRDAEWIGNGLVPVTIMLVRRGHVPEESDEGCDEEQDRQEELAQATCIIMSEVVLPPPLPELL